ncbi:hypothetical protein Q31a_43220 [Aureliella helgolandensis]|uniref:Uncharacterized protein n=1 Tax=Aureliella helgolandensis TaxID=2527968 RepID=A0A518GBK9_9BACT|nr:hypothetical protein Q31a_43220 [Aureliella helgolandensis]
MRHLDPCPACNHGTLRRYSTKTQGNLRRRYLKCDSCHQHGQEVFPVDDLGRPVFPSTFTPAGNTRIDQSCAPDTLDRTAQ